MALNKLRHDVFVGDCLQFLSSKQEHFRKFKVRACRHLGAGLIRLTSLANGFSSVWISTSRKIKRCGEHIATLFTPVLRCLVMCGLAWLIRHQDPSVITNTQRIDAALPTIKYCLEKAGAWPTFKETCTKCFSV